MTKPPLRVILLLCLVLTFTLWNILQLWTAIAWDNVLNEFHVHPPPTVTAVSGALWTLCGIILIWGILLKKDRATKLVFGTAAGYTVWYWSERLIWQRPHPNWPFVVIANLALIIFILFTTRSLTREKHE